MCRELDTADVSGTANVGGVEFTTRAIAAQVVPDVSGRDVVASTPDGLPAPTTELAGFEPHTADTTDRR